MTPPAPRVLLRAPRCSHRVAAALGALVLATPVVIGLTGLSSGATTTSVTTQWYGYHGDPLGTGVALGIHTVDVANPSWTSHTLDGQIYGEPLVYDHEVIVATENDSVYALSATSGRVVWSRHVATAVPSGDLPCGDISPSVGITGTPVIDPARHEVFVADAQLVNGSPRHFMYGLNLDTGHEMMRRAIDLPSSYSGDAKAYLQRSGLALDDGSVIFTMGGNYGDCPTYHGVVGAVAETGAGAVKYFVVDAAKGDSQGAIWMGGAAPAVDTKGDVWVESGNGSVTSSGNAYDDSDGVLELTPAMRLKSYFAPSTWRHDNATDADLSDEPALLSDGQVVATGKSGNVYLLNAARLGGINGQEATIASGCGNDLDGGSTIHGTTVYLPCLSGPVAVRVTSQPATIKVLWHASVGGGPPILAAGRLWTMDTSGNLYGLNPNSGAVLQKVNVGVPANHFPTPSVGDGLLLVANATQVVAFRAT